MKELRPNTVRQCLLCGSLPFDSKYDTWLCFDCAVYVWGRFVPVSCG